MPEQHKSTSLLFKWIDKLLDIAADKYETKKIEGKICKELTFALENPNYDGETDKREHIEGDNLIVRLFPVVKNEDIIYMTIDTPMRSDLTPFKSRAVNKSDVSAVINKYVTDEGLGTLEDSEANDEPDNIESCVKFKINRQGQKITASSIIANYDPALVFADLTAIMQSPECLDAFSEGTHTYSLIQDAETFDIQEIDEKLDDTVISFYKESLSFYMAIRQMSWACVGEDMIKSKEAISSIMWISSDEVDQAGNMIFMKYPNDCDIFQIDSPTYTLDTCGGIDYTDVIDMLYELLTSHIAALKLYELDQNITVKLSNIIAQYSEGLEQIRRFRM